MAEQNPDYQGPNRRQAVLTDADHDAIAQKLYVRMKNDFYLNAGKGFVNGVFKLAVMVLLVMATYGYAKGWFKL